MHQQNPHAKPSTFTGHDWQTSRRTLADALSTLDSIQALTVGIMPEETPYDLSETDMLRLMASLAEDAQHELNMLRADQMPELLRQPAAHWAAVEAQQLLEDFSSLCAEARQALRQSALQANAFYHPQSANIALPGAVMFELGYLAGRIKELLKAAEV